MVLILLSTIPPSLTPTSASTLSPLSPRSQSTSPFFAILSPLFDQNGPEDSYFDQLVPSAAAPSPSAESAHAAPAPTASARVPRVPALKSTPPRGRSTIRGPPTSPRSPISPMASRLVDKQLPPTPNSPAHPSPLHHAYTFSHRPNEIDVVAAERLRFQSVPSVQISAAPQVPPTVAEVIDANGSHIVRSLSRNDHHSRADTAPQSAALWSPRSPVRSPRSPAPALRSRSGSAHTPNNALATPTTPSSGMLSRSVSSGSSYARIPHRYASSRNDDTQKTGVSVAMSGVDLDIPSSSASSHFPLSPRSPATPHTPHTAASTLFTHHHHHHHRKHSASNSLSVPSTSLSVPTSAAASSFEDVDSMEVPLAIDTFLLPALSDPGADDRNAKALPRAPLLAPAPPTRPKHRKAASTTGTWRRGTMFQPLEEIGKPIGCW